MTDKKIPRKSRQPAPGQFAAALTRTPTLTQRIAGLAASPTTQQKPGAVMKGLGKASPITRAKKAPAGPATPLQGGGTIEQLKAAFLGQINTPLRAKSGHPTLAERIRHEGIDAQRAGRTGGAKVTRANAKGKADGSSAGAGAAKPQRGRARRHGQKRRSEAAGDPGE